MSRNIWTSCCILLVIVVQSEASGKIRRIVGGSTLPIKIVPYQVSIAIRGELLCGGSIIAPKWILTAAHCLMVVNDNVMIVRVGSDQYRHGGIVRDVQWSVSHPGFNHPEGHNDIGLILLNEMLYNNGLWKCVLLAQQGQRPLEGAISMASGWGTTADPGQISERLKYTFLPVTSMDSCLQNYTWIGLDRNNHFCAGYFVNRTCTCYGDSGGPLVIDGLQYGLLSFGNDCIFADVFTNVGSFRSWIDAIVIRYSFPHELQCPYFS
ncbi:trypsin-6-like [Ochlerotatus camptorhynchus]|uniref:trypsin-6-like n=1 Tax=Ochlerotatus camptorhynchus TaxID=644619 RepID=UPI0031D2F896